MASAIGDSQTPARLMFVTATRKIDLGYFSQKFVSSQETIEAFIRDGSAGTLEIAEGLTFRTLAANVVAIVMLALTGVLFSSLSSHGDVPARSVYDNAS